MGCVGEKNSIHFFNHLAGLNVSAVKGEGVLHRFPRHTHEGYCIGLVRKGSRTLIRSGKSTVIPENGMFVINPGEGHECVNGGVPHSYSVLCADKSIMNGFFLLPKAAPKAMPVFEQAPLFDEVLRKKFIRLFSIIEGKSPVLALDESLLAVLSHLVVNHGHFAPDPGPQNHGDAVNRARRFIRENCSDDITLIQIADFSNLSPYHFHRIFLEKTGVSPHEYLIQQRIVKARDLLSGKDSLSLVALETGFADQSHFSRIFKRMTGITP